MGEYIQWFFRSLCNEGVQVGNVGGQGRYLFPPSTDERSGLRVTASLSGRRVDSLVEKLEVLSLVILLKCEVRLVRGRARNSPVVIKDLKREAVQEQLCFSGS